MSKLPSSVIDEWSHSQHIRLMCGELTESEVRLVKSVMHAIRPRIAALESLLMEEDYAQEDAGEYVPLRPLKELLALYRHHLPMLPSPRPEIFSNSAGGKALGQRWRWIMTAKRETGERYATTKEEGLNWFSEFFAVVAQSDFLTGADGKWRGCDLSWLMKLDNFQKVMQGNYSKRT